MRIILAILQLIHAFSPKASVRNDINVMTMTACVTITDYAMDGWAGSESVTYFPCVVFCRL
jgi:hypothetical protein